ncbi:MAG TPA: hypothetical protein VHV10_02215 [Ktedonobacteraceae bacterium]|jgi:hypothetical protein|nr:hypothetical protein [Ktedonobacteraceae bacterium]
MGKNWGGARPGAGAPKMKDRVNQKLHEKGWNWMSSAEKYIRVGHQYPQERRYWIAPYVSPDDNAVRERDAQGFRSLKEIEEFLDERI